MKKSLLLTLLVVPMLGALLTGCSSSSGDPKLNTAAPAPEAGAIPDTPMVNKNRPGANGPAGGGTAGSPGGAGPQGAAK